jgi:hypothetical protein
MSRQLLDGHAVDARRLFIASHRPGAFRKFSCSSTSPMVVHRLPGFGFPPSPRTLRASSLRAFGLHPLYPWRRPAQVELAAALNRAMGPLLDRLWESAKRPRRWLSPTENSGRQHRTASAASSIGAQSILILASIYLAFANEAQDAKHCAIFPSFGNPSIGCPKPELTRRRQ